MSRTYTNRKGDRIEVSDEHLDKAIAIKLELQKLSPSRICSWVKHRKMMESEGFGDSDVNEAYRCMIKEEQKRRGILPALEKHVDLMAENKLEAIKELVGEMRHTKLELQAESRAMNRTKRALSGDILLLERIEKALLEIDFPKFEYVPISNSRFPTKSMIANLSDFHYGAYVDIEGQKYDVEIAEECLMRYADKLTLIAKHENVEEIHVMQLGDLIENAYLRPQNIYSIEKNQAEQIVEATNLVIKFLTKLSAHTKVIYSGINGNHDRMQGDKNLSLFSDGAVQISNAIIKQFSEIANANILYEESEPYHHIIEKNGRTFLFVHGDKTPLGRKSILAEQSLLYGRNFDAIIGGHIHHFTIKEVSENKYITTFGSIKGSDEYSLKTIGSTASRSQGIILISEDGEFEIRKIGL